MYVSELFAGLAANDSCCNFQTKPVIKGGRSLGDNSVLIGRLWELGLHLETLLILVELLRLHLKSHFKCF